MTVLGIDSRGPEVERLQQALQAQGYFLGAVDGWYGLKTAAAVAYFQSCNGLDIDALSGSQVYEYLDLNDTIEVTLSATWPTIEVWHPGDEIVVQLAPFDGVPETDVRVVMWFRSAAGAEQHAEVQERVQGGSTTLARLTLPESIAQDEGEVHYTGYVFDMHGLALGDEGTGSFRVDLPTRI